MTAIDPDALDAEIRERIAGQVAASTARREERRQERAQLAERRTAGLQQRHTRKTNRHAQGSPMPDDSPGLGSSRRAQARIHAGSAPAPARRSGRGAGYEHREELLTANRALGAALSKLARDSDPAARQAGADIAATVADLVRQATVAAGESSGKSRRAAADVARRMPRLVSQLDALKARLADRMPSEAVRNP